MCRVAYAASMAQHAAPLAACMAPPSGATRRSTPAARAGTLPCHLLFMLCPKDRVAPTSYARTDNGLLNVPEPDCRTHWTPRAYCNWDVPRCHGQCHGPSHVGGFHQCPYVSLSLPHGFTPAGWTATTFTSAPIGATVAAAVRQRHFIPGWMPVPRHGARAGQLANFGSAASAACAAPEL